MFKEKFDFQCKKRGKKPVKVCQELNLSSGTYSSWKDGRVPRKATLNKIAEYFQISVNELLKENQVDFTPKESLTEQEKELLRLFRETDEAGRFKIIAAVMNIIEEKPAPSIEDAG